MTGKQLEDRLGFQRLYAPDVDISISGGYTSDLLSDVMANAEEGSVLITIQAHRNCVAVASLTGITGIILCSSRKVPTEMIEAAKEQGIAIYVSQDNQFTVSWKVAGLLAEERICR